MSEKNGGPYTKSDQDKRRRQVYELHFEKSQSALHIAQTLGVNRNTINEDIRYWYCELASTFDNLEIRDLMLKQHSRLEQQRIRLETLLQKQQDVFVILKIERMLFDIDRAIAKILVPIASAKTIPEKEAVETMQYLLECDESGKITGYSEVQLLQDIIEYKKCDSTHAQKILDKIMSLGLGLFQNQRPIIQKSYDMLGFAEKRSILPDEKLQEIYHKMEKRHEEQKQEIKEHEIRDSEIEIQIEKEFIQRYGPKSGWDHETWKDYYHRIDYFDG